ncbi:nitrate reductase molybdenum cofactor assembly chaperone [Nocardiopsis tropica]|uniref:Nitrate reductase molybdenum cofactor assembly chaperone n=2 Tax=Nocardiopsis tropica TaxID=109330 RepID=A0ABU7KIC6_9ACTN|nr:nitrate reductase molybdenum cofactor assembly chaperone [Nocardiopsis umidischolae]MEE2049055.1 nitrate reductase molybdenum cofactor assembly chaperone [Nocardiopsis umidischolae]
MSTTTDGADGHTGGATGGDRAAAVEGAGVPAVPVQRGPGWLGAGRSARRSHRIAVTHQAASVLLAYPDQAFFERLPLVARAVAELPRGTVRTELQEFCEHAASTPELELCRHYVDVFDLRRRRALHMTYYTDGDTRRRGHALAEIKRVYAESGWSVTAGELPDHLAVVLEFAARGDAARGGALLLRFRPGLDLLWEALRAHGTPYARVVDAVRMTLPPQRRDDREAVRRLAAEGPPAEDVGLEPYGVRVPLPVTDVSGRGVGGPAGGPAPAPGVPAPRAPGSACGCGDGGQA